MILARWWCVFLIFGQCLYSYELSIVSMFQNEAPYLKEWIEYHRLAGVEHFYLYNNNSTDDGLSILQPYIDEGLVEIIDWPYKPKDAVLTAGSFVGIQMDAFKNGLKRTRGVSEWVAFIDIDEFIVPFRCKTITQSLNQNYKDANAVFLNWRNFGTSNVIVPLGEPLLTKLITSSLATHSDNNIGKSIVRPEVIDIDKTWYPHHFVLLPEYEYVNGDNQLMAKDGLTYVNDCVHHNRFMVIHHYCLRDEWFYENVRLAKAKRGIGNLPLLQEHYDSFNLMPNYDAVNFLKKYHKEKYETFWKL